MRLGLLDLLAPQFLAGFDLPDAVEELLTFLDIDELQAAWDEAGVVYAGKVQFTGTGDASLTPRFRTPSGTSFEPDDINIQFRLTLPRAGADQIRMVVNDSPLLDLKEALDHFEVISGGVPLTPSDYPGFAFRLELLLNGVFLPLSEIGFIPARVASDGWLERDTTYEQVRLHLPNIAIVISQGETIGEVGVDLASWGINSLDDPSDPKAGEAIRMVPAICLHQSQVFGFGLEKAVLDFSENFTPPEILEKFGIGDEFTGLWLPHVRFFLAPARTTGFAFDVLANDLLVDFESVNTGDLEVSGELAFDIIRRNHKLEVTPRLLAGSEVIAITRGSEEETDNATVISGSRTTMPAGDNIDLHLAITGGMPPYDVTVTLNGSTITGTPFEGNPNRLTWHLGAVADSSTLHFRVEDNSSPRKSWDETIELQHRAVTAPTASQPASAPPIFHDISGTPGYQLVPASEQPDPEAVILRATPANVDSVTVGTFSSSSGEVRVPVTPGGGAGTVEARWPATTTPMPEPEEVTVLFAFDDPRTTNEIDVEVSRIIAQQGANLTQFLQRANGQTILIEGNASYEGYLDREPFNENLSNRRVETLRRVLAQLAEQAGITANISPGPGNGTQRARGVLSAIPGCGTRPNGPTPPDYQPECYRNAIARYTPASAPTEPAPSRRVTVERPAPTTEPPEMPTVTTPTPTEPERPSVFRRAGIRFRLERNQLVLAEINGELDFETQAEASARTIRDATGRSDETALTVTSHEGATANQEDPPQGIVDFRITAIYDTATGRLTLEASLGFDRNSRQGFVSIENGSPEFIGNTIGALLTFAPLLFGPVNSAVTAEGEDATVPIIVAAAEIALAAILGLAGVFQMKKFTLFGVQLSHTDGEVAALFDYAIDFAIDLDIGVLTIRSDPDSPLRARYRAVGVRLLFPPEEGDSGTRFLPVFDTSKGYEFDLADPGLFDIGEPLGSILKVLGARVSRTNPPVLELDIGLKANLGVITVDRLRVTQALGTPLSPPALTPMGAGVNIPGALIGKGFIDLRDGFAGSLDVTLLPVGLRIAATLKVQQAQDTASGRNATGVFLALVAEFPTAIPLFSSGLGLYGVLGLFAMHFKRLEDSNADIPALDWFHRVAMGDPTEPNAWGTENALDKWSFGVGAVLGTLDGVCILNLKGMLLLELPGPRILIFMNAKVLTEKPETKGTGDSLGILAIVDINIPLQTLTIGILIEYEIRRLLSIRIPVEAGFDFRDISKWHLYLGKIEAPISCEILGIVKGSAYLMFAGDQIENFPTPRGPVTLPGLAIALGIRAALILGNENIGLYLKVSASLDAGLSFSPFHIYGFLELRGTLRLFIISISAWASLAVEANDSTYIVGEACGEIDCFLFSIKGCVGISIGSTPTPVPPNLVRSMILQSRSPALIQGQGTDRPIDGSLGDAVEVDSVGGTPDRDLPTVPIDAMPVLKLHAAPATASDFSTFTRPLEQAPRLAAPDGFAAQSENVAVRYTLKRLEINPPLPDLPDPPLGLGLPPAVFRRITDSAEGKDTSVDLALFSWDPDHTPRAVQRSQELTDRITQSWGHACDLVAPAAPVLWTFNRQQLGPSETGWRLNGAAWPDPPDTRRGSAPNTRVFVHEAAASSMTPLIESLLTISGQRNLEPAKVIGDAPPVPVFFVPTSRLPGRVLQLPFLHPAAASDFVLPPEYDPFIDPEPERILIESGRITVARILLAVNQKILQAGASVVFRAYDATGNLLDERPLSALPVAIISSLIDLPPRWRDTFGPWSSDVTLVMKYLMIRHPALQRVLIEWSPPPATTRLEIVVFRPRILGLPPAVLVGAIELLRQEEHQRVEHDERARDATINTIEGALLGGQLRPLLQPGTEYTISLTYAAEVRVTDEDGNSTISSTEDKTQHFKFMTDANAPERFDPWILTTTPFRDQQLHFVDDPVQIYFNDASAIQLFEAYGKPLKAVIRKANGDHPEEQPAIVQDALERIDAGILTPFEETLRSVIDGMSCITTVESEKHYMFEVTIPLERGTAYTLDIETNDPPPTGVPLRPLFRISFTTSRFLSAAELAEVIRTSRSTHRFLRNPLGVLAATPPDADIQNALLEAGLEAVTPAKQPSLTFLWEPEGDNFRLVALIIDSPEPLWRTRSEPEKVPVQSESGDMFHWVLSENPFLQIVELSTAAVQRFVRSPGGTRTLVMLNPGATHLNLALRQQELDLSPDPSPITDYLIYSALLPAEPPWRLNDV